MRSRFLRLLVWWVLLAAAFGTLALPGPARHGPAPLADVREGAERPDVTVLVLTLVPLVLVLVLVLLNVDFSAPRALGHDLDHLLQLKHRGFPRPRRLRESRTWISRSPPGHSPAAAAGPVVMAPPADVLAQLVQLKRCAAWAPRLPNHVREGPAHPG